MSIEVRKPTSEEEASMKQCPTWEKEPSEFPWHYDDKETCLVLEGEVIVEAPDQTVSFGPGDFVVFLGVVGGRIVLGAVDDAGLHRRVQLTE